MRAVPNEEYLITDQLSSTATAAGVAALTIQNSSIAQNAANHADHHLYVTKQKDTEARAANPYNLLDPVDPLVNFAKYFDGESLDQQDV